MTKHIKKEKPFWQIKSLDEMSEQEWENLCDGCGKCCLHKLENDNTGEVHYTNVACRLLCHQTIRCENYENRRRFVPDCISLTPEKLKTLSWLPPSCAYFLLANDKPLPHWHHLITGSYDSIHDAGASVKGKIISEQEAGDLKEHVIDKGEI